MRAIGTRILPVSDGPGTEVEVGGVDGVTPSIDRRSFRVRSREFQTWAVRSLCSSKVF